MMAQFHIHPLNNHILSDLDGKEAVFPFGFKQIISIDKVSVAITREKGSRNVVGIDMEGNIQWRIVHHPWAYDNTPYSEVEQRGQTCYIYNIDGFGLTVDPLSGEILAQVQAK